jgi:phage terminase large subunit-like protein
MYHEQHVVRARVGVAAASQEQAGIIFERVDSFVQLSELDQEFRCQEGNRRIHCDRTLGRIQIYASDARTGDGIIGSLLVLEELHRHRDLRLYRTWLGKLEKREAQMIVISTAGEPESEFEDERTMMRREADELVKDHGDCRTIARAPGRYVLHDWAVPKPDQVEDLEVVARANPLKVNTVAALTRKRNLPGWTLPHWKRFTCGLATRDEVHAVGELEWEAAHVKNSKRQPYPDIPQGEEVWLGLDFAWKWDTTALVPLWAPEPEFRLIGIPTILTPPRNGNMLPTQDVKEAIAALHERTPIRTAVADVSLAQDVCQWVEDELGVEVVDRGQSNPHKVEDYDRFMEALRNGWLWHCGDRALTRHVMNATAKLLPMGDTIFERPSASRHGSMQHRRVIDGLTAACHAHTSAAAELMLGEPLVAY